MSQSECLLFAQLVFGDDVPFLNYSDSTSRKEHLDPTQGAQIEGVQTNPLQRCKEPLMQLSHTKPAKHNTSSTSLDFPQFRVPQLHWLPQPQLKAIRYCVQNPESLPLKSIVPTTPVEIGNASVSGFTSTAYYGHLQVIHRVVHKKPWR